ncbi:hypothetical protein Tco_1090687 [Tanacetum coccineum]|uniref:Uncharacterized protein n=1 Tax=Tanacetum coccineum TaxID=301880 RepID=A0ABQ5I4Z7_9ASTR
MKPKKKDTQIPQSSVPSDDLADEAVNEENVSKHSNDPLLSCEDRLKLEELMALCTNLQNRILDLEHTKTTQALKIDSLKRRVKKLEKKQKSKTHGLKRLYKGRKIHDIDVDEDITLKNVHGEDMFGVNDLDGDEVVVKSEVADKDVNLSVDEVTLAQALAALKTEEEDEEEERLAREKAQQIKEANTIKEESSFQQKRAKAKRNKPPTQAQQRKLYSTYLKNMEGYTLKQLKGFKFEVIKDMFDRAFKRVNTFVDHEKELIEKSSKKGENEKESSSKRTGEKFESDKSKKQKLDKKVEAEVDDDKEAEELKQCLEIVPDDGDDVIVDATPLSIKMPIVDYKIYQERKKSFFQIIRANGNSQMYLTFTKMLKNFDREDLEVLWRIVKARFKKTEPNQQGLVKVLNWKLYDSCGIHYVTMHNILYYMLVEKTYPLTKHTLHQMFNDVKLQVDYECKMAFELLRLVKKQLKEGYVP